MALAHSPRIITDGLKLLLDAANVKSTSVGDIFYVGGTSNSDSSSSFTLNGLQAGDLVLYFGACGSTPLNTPTGESWTSVPGLENNPDNDYGPNSAAFYAIATGTSVTASGLRTNPFFGDDFIHVMIAFRNVDPLNPFVVNAIQNSPRGRLPDPPSITTNFINSMIVAVGFRDDQDFANNVSPPTGYTTAVNMDSQGGVNLANSLTINGGATVMTAYKLLKTAAAAEDPGPFISSNSDIASFQEMKGITIALRPNSSDIWKDISGNDNRVIGFSPGKRYFESYAGGVFDFYGTIDELYMNNSNDLAFTNALLSINVWIYIDDLTNSFPIINKRGPTQLDNLDYSLEVSSDGKVRLIIDSNFECETATGLIEENTWYNLTATHDGNTAKIYINGVQSVSVSSNKSSISTDVKDIVSIGSAYSNYPNKVYAIGKIASIAMYSRALTPEDVLQNYDAIKGRFLNAGSPPIKIFSALQTLATTLASVSVPIKQGSNNSIANDDDSVQSIIESAHSSFNVFAVVGYQSYAEELRGRGVAGGMRTHTATGFNYNTSLSNILSTGNAIVEMSGGGRINPNLNVIDGKKWMAMAQFDGTKFDGILLWIFTGDSVNTAGNITPNIRSVSNVKDIFYPAGRYQASVDGPIDYHHIYPIAIDPDGTITSNTTPGASGWNFSTKSQADEILGYYLDDSFGRNIRDLSRDDGLWGFNMPGYVDGDNRDLQRNIDYGMGNIAGNDDGTRAYYNYWNGVESFTLLNLGFVFSGDA